MNLGPATLMMFSVECPLKWEDFFSASVLDFLKSAVDILSDEFMLALLLLLDTLRKQKRRQRHIECRTSESSQELRCFCGCCGVKIGRFYWTEK